MKNISIKKALTLILSLFLAGCVTLDEKPTGQLSPSVIFTSEDGFTVAITGIYYQLYRDYEGFDYAYPLLTGGGAEDISTNHAYTVFKGLDELKPTPETPALGSVWRQAYLAIGNANNVILNAGTANGIPEAKRQAFEAEAKFLRALCYFNLTRWFGRVPLITEQNTQQAETEDEATEQSIYALMISDLQFAESHLANAITQKSRPTTGAAKALLAKVYLTMAGYPLKDATKYALARDKAAEVMGLGYALEENFADLWLTEFKLTNTESIFAFFGAYNIPNVGSHLHLASRPWEGEAGWGDFFSEPRLFNAFPPGPRKDASFLSVFKDGTPWDQSLEAMPFIAKYRDGGRACGPDDTSCQANGEGFFTVLRYADVLLVYAEAANMAAGAPTSEAYNAINQVRRRANGKNPTQPDAASDLSSGLSREAFDKAVLDERLWELAFEGHRWFDLVRRELVVDVNKDLYPYVDAHNLLLPKPASELSVAKGTINQNLGY